jgi:hypothetical protein
MVMAMAAPNMEAVIRVTPVAAISPPIGPRFWERVRGEFSGFKTSCSMPAICSWSVAIAMSQSKSRRTRPARKAAAGRVNPVISSSSHDRPNLPVENGITGIESLPQKIVITC